MSEDYTFDASITISADDFESKEDAANWILEVLVDLDIAAFLCDEGTLNTKGKL